MKFIKVENFSGDDQVQVISLNRPEVRNAFHPGMIAEITEFFINENLKNKSKLIILRAEGKSFCAGADLNWMKDMINYSLVENIEDSIRLWNMFEALQNCQIPIVGVVHGAAFGGALGILSCCDYVYAEEGTQFCFSEVKLGLAPAIIAGFISRKIQDAFYRPLMFSAEVFTSLDAKNIGLIQRTYSKNIEISAIVKNFSANGVTAMKETKKLLNSLLTTMQRDRCVRVISELRMSAEGQERMKKFL